MSYKDKITRNAMQLYQEMNTGFEIPYRITAAITQRNIDILTKHGEFIDSSDGKSTIHFRVPFRGAFVYVYDWKGQNQLTINAQVVKNKTNTARAFIEHFKLDA